MTKEGTWHNYSTKRCRNSIPFCNHIFLHVTILHSQTSFRNHISLRARRFMSQAGRTIYFARSATRESSLCLALRAHVALRAKYRIRQAWLIKRLSCRPTSIPESLFSASLSRWNRETRKFGLSTELICKLTTVQRLKS